MQRQHRSRVLFYLTALIFLAGVGCLVAGVVLMVRAKQGSKEKTATNPKPSTRDTYSREAKRVGLDKLLQKVQTTYFELYPNKAAFIPSATSLAIKTKYRPFNPTPSSIKHKTDSSRELLRELESLQVSPNKLRQSEKRALAQAKYWVYHVFAYGVPYGYDYYTGDWLLGPDIFCWAPVCHIIMELETTLTHFKPSDVADVELFRQRLEEVGAGVRQYRENIEAGVSTGMVRSTEECESGLSSLKVKFRTIALHGESGVLNASFLQPVLRSDFLDGFVRKADQMRQWESKYGSSVNDSLKKFLVTYVGRPIRELMRYLETDYSTHCVSSNISSGMSSIPLKHVYVNNTPTTASSGKLPTGELLNGTKSYSKLLAYFTTTDITADGVHSLGLSLIQDLYDEVFQLAREISGESNNETAKTKLQAKLAEPSNYFNDEPIPANESDKNAHALCSSEEAAQIHCPVRWRAMVNWFQYVRQLITLLNNNMLDLFHMVGPKTSVPSCPVETKPDFNPLTPVPTYVQTDPACTRAAVYKIPFFHQKPGPKSDEWTMTAHEVKPGHHLQTQVFNEHFSSEDRGVSKWLSNTLHFLSFDEGWAMYAEDPLIARETIMYDEAPLMKFGALKWQIVRTMRLILDTGLHAKGMSRDEALKMFKYYSWDTSDIPGKEITRYQSVPGQAISYMFGKVTIMKLRREATQQLGEKFNLKDFHYHVLRHGSAPLSYLEDAIRKYISCVLNSEEEGCDEVLRPVKREESSSFRVVYEDKLTSFYVG